jgi:hypothetical protein
VTPAQQALETVQRSPREAIALARRVLVTARGQDAADERATAERAIGLGLRELHDFAGALRHLRRAVRVADRSGSTRTAALARTSYAYVLSNVGRNAAATRELDAALAHLDGMDAGHAVLLRGMVRYYCGRFEEATRDFDAAVDAAGRHGERLVQARALNNRGVLHGYRGDSRRATADLDRAAALFAELGQELAALDVRWNAGNAIAQRGDVPAALRIFAAADGEYRRLDVPRPALLLDRIELLLSVPLIEEARVLADAAVAELRRRGMASDLAEALLARARAALLAGDLDAAEASAAEAGDGFRRQRRRSWEAFARHIRLRAAFLRGERSPALLRATVRVAGALDEVGWRSAALTARIDAARIAADLGRPDRAREQLAQVRRARRGGTAAQRAQGWYAEALRRRLDADPAGAGAALRRGLETLEEYRVSLGATELRARSGVHGEALAAEGLDIALAGGRAGQVLDWAERGRAGALRMTPALPPDDPDLAGALAELRAVTSELSSALLDGRVPPAGLARRQAQLEQRVRELTRQAAAAGAVDRPPRLRSLAAALGDAVLVEYVAHGGRLLAVVVGDGRGTLHDLGELDGLLRELSLLRFALHRLATLPPALLARSGAGANAAALAGRIDRRCLAPLRSRTGDRPLVVVPTGALNAVPWWTLPACRGRPVTVAPSAAVWYRAATAAGGGNGSRPAGAPVLAAGPRLPAAPAEVAALAARVPGATVLTGPDATARAVGQAIDGAPLVHLAAHGTFRADNPLFSAVEFADGPLTVYDLERLRRPPELIVLSACDSGLSAVHPGDELMGLSAALLALGTRTLIATVSAVPAEATAALMLDLHGRMRAGTPPAAALAAAQEAGAGGGDGGGDGPRDGVAWATSAGFVCFGAGWEPG